MKGCDPRVGENAGVAARLPSQRVQPHKLGESIEEALAGGALDLATAA